MIASVIIKHMMILHRNYGMFTVPKSINKHGSTLFINVQAKPNSKGNKIV